MEQLTMAIAGMNCTGCLGNVEQVLAEMPGTHVEAVIVGYASVSYDPDRTSPDALAQAIADAGYTPDLPEGRTAIRPGRRTGAVCCGGREHTHESGHKA
ncbi:MAG: heavy metal-associated domain-containing protein [Gemmatimonadota bacterium]